MESGEKMQVFFDENALQIIRNLQNMSGRSSISEVLRDALGLYNWTLKMSEEGYSIGTIKNGEAIQEVVLPFVIPKK